MKSIKNVYLVTEMIAHEESRLDQEARDQAAQKPPSDPLMVEEGSPHKKRKI